MHDPDLCISLRWVPGDLGTCSHVHWLLCGHLQAPVVHSHHEPACLWHTGETGLGGGLHSSAQILLVLRLPFCGHSVIGHYFCDMQPLLKLACIDTYVINLLIVFNSGAICMVSFILLLISYVFILRSLNNHSPEGRKKALSTCTSQIIVIVLFLYCIYTHTLAL